MAGDRTRADGLKEPVFLAGQQASQFRFEN